MSILTVKNLVKRYPAFTLEDVSFSLAAGKITGFIGRNGAGKTTTLKSLLNLVHPDGGEISFFGRPFAADELAAKQRIGFATGGIHYYPKVKIKTITDTTRRFYQNWDDAAYADYMRLFNLDENKTPSALSEGMKVKYALALALSHRAELLILDEPTSGLDPISRDDLLDVFLALCERGITILFSTHITSDLDKCADNILYIQNGKLIADDELQHFLAGYRVLTFAAKPPADALIPMLIGPKKGKHGTTALLRTADAQRLGLPGADADLEAVMVHLEKEGPA